ncbi:MAG: hypothetical protein VZR09_02040 [Candidatus Gastranaerophilaceae bacterium]|nr:hypothetical protein [Candidatus Gastranaerophilaceae bacterium]
MDFDVVRSSITSAYRNFKFNDTKFVNSMHDFYNEGAKNPSVAKIIMQDQIRKGQETSRKILTEVASLPTPGLFEPTEATFHLYNFSAQFAAKSINAADMYNSTSYNEYVGNTARKTFDEAWDKLYPKSGKTRERIILANRILTDSVTPKAGWLDKLRFAKTIAEYKTDYPNTFAARYWLIMNSQIKEDSVTLRVKPWCKRFFYKRLIKNHFGFKK